MIINSIISLIINIVDDVVTKTPNNRKEMAKNKREVRIHLCCYTYGPKES